MREMNPTPLNVMISWWLTDQPNIHSSHFNVELFARYLEARALKIKQL